MIKEFLPNHLEFIRTNIPEGSILVYKGFPNTFIELVSEVYGFLGNQKYFNVDGLVDLALLESSKRDIIKSFLDPIDKTSVILYEEFLLVDKEINLESMYGGTVYIFENSLYSGFYPNSSTESNIDIELAVDEESNIQDNELFGLFYSNSTNFRGFQLIQYKTTKDTLNIKYLDFYNTIIISNNFEFQQGTEGESVFIGSNSDEFNEILYKLYANNLPKNLKFHFKYDEIQSGLNIHHINELFTRLGFNISVSKFNNTSLTLYREELNGILMNNWGYSNFRNISFYENPDLSRQKKEISQGVLIEDIISQVEKAKKGKGYSDILITAPTGAGKSVIFQVPAIYLAQKLNLVTIVVSPLIALMYDQINSLKNKGVYMADYINSEKTPSEKEEILNKLKNGEISILYLSPESLLSYDISHFIGDRELGLLVIDEAHLVTTWGRDFRVDYWYLGNYIRKVRKYNTKFVTLALTATAIYGGDDDMVFETIDSLNMKTPAHLYIGNVVRDDIEFNFREFIYEGTYHQERLEKTKSVIRRYAILGKKTLVYCPYESQVKELYAMLSAESYGMKVGVYYGNLDKTQKKRNLDAFKSGDLAVMIATKAFGMGIDIDDINIVYHHAPSGNIPDYLQEIGRVARKTGMTGFAEIDYCNKDLSFSKALHGLSSIKQYECKFVLDKIYSIFDIRNRFLREQAMKEGRKYKMQQNFLVSVEDFAFIFGDAQNIDNRLKNILLLIEKDLLQKHKFNIIVARPKQLFTIAFIAVDKNIEDAFIEEYGDYIKMDETINGNKRSDRWGVSVNDIGDIFRIDLQKLWEERFASLSFPLLKKALYEQTLFPSFENKVVPRLRIRINLKDSNISLIREILFQKFSLLEQVFASEVFNGKYVKEVDLDNEIKKVFNDDMIAIKIKEILINFYTSSNEWGISGGGLGLDNFIQVKNDKSGFHKEYRIISSAYQKVKNAFIKHFDTMFLGIADGVYEKYLAKNSKDDYRLKIAGVLELLGLGTYEVEGGEYPRIFIRINDPFRIKRITEKGDYLNSMVLNIERRYKRSIKYIDTFFTNMTNEERWDFIESYFLGKSLEK